MAAWEHLPPVRLDGQVALLVQPLGLGGGTMLDDRQSGEVGERASDDDIRLRRRRR